MSGIKRIAVAVAQAKGAKAEDVKYENSEELLKEYPVKQTPKEK